MNIQIFGTKKCNDTKKAERFFKERGIKYQFTVVMPNLNYNVPQDVPQGVPQDKLDAQIVDLIRKDSKISTEKIAIALGVSSKTIKRHIKGMDNLKINTGILETSYFSRNSASMMTAGI